MSEISDTLLKQRLRNRIIEMMDLLSNSECVEKIGTDEALESWFDYVDEDKLNFYDEPIFSKEEKESIKDLHKHIESTYDDIPTTWDKSEIAFCQAWSKVVMLSNKGYQVFLKRGTFDEETEIT